jgi:hypothetical protein
MTSSYCEISMIRDDYGDGSGNGWGDGHGDGDGDMYGDGFGTPARNADLRLDEDGWGDGGGYGNGDLWGVYTQLGEPEQPGNGVGSGY